jgi:hypothetical protein
LVACVNVHDITRAFHVEIDKTEPPRVVTDLDQLRSVGLSVWQSGNHSFMTLRLTMDG